MRIITLTVVGAVFALPTLPAAEPTPAPPQQTLVDEAAAYATCAFDRTELNGICADLRAKDASRYMRKFVAFACLQGEGNNPSPAYRAQAHRAWEIADVRCNGDSIMQRAITVRVFDFVTLAINRWCVNPNQRNEAGQTLMDYVEFEQARSASARETLQPYAYELRRGGNDE
jgi:hypothetical protein